jgi:hypothetical protein
MIKKRLKLTAVFGLCFFMFLFGGCLGDDSDSIGTCTVKAHNRTESISGVTKDWCLNGSYSERGFDVSWSAD